jgi:hypothetical protein
MPWLHIDIEFVSEKAQAKWLENHESSITADATVRFSQFEECKHGLTSMQDDSQRHEKEDTTQAGQ